MEAKMKQLTIGELAKRAKVNVQTVRYYERRGLMPEPPRRASGYRQYSQNDIGRLRFIRHGKDLGFSLKEIRELLSLRVDPDTTCEDVKTCAEEKLAEIEAKVQALQQVKTALTKLAASCKGQGPTSECPILEALESFEEP
jgi:MerR family mercuric resistance operon transcriptional regulator